MSEPDIDPVSEAEAGAKPEIELRPEPDPEPDASTAEAKAAIAAIAAMSALSEVERVSPCTPAFDVTSPAVAQERATPPAAPRSQHLGSLAVLAAASLLLVACGPWLMTRTVLTALVRGELREVGQGSTLASASLDWTHGLKLRRVLVRDAGVQIVLERVDLETDLLSACLGAVSGSPVDSRLVLAGGLLDVSLGDGSQGEDEEPPSLVTPLRSALEIDGVDISVSSSDSRLELRRSSGKGVCRITQDMAVSLEEPFLAACAELILTRRGPSGWVELLRVVEPQLTFRRLSVPGHGETNTGFALEVTVEGTSFKSDELFLNAGTVTIEIEGDVSRFEITGALPDVADAVSATVTLDATRDDRWPLAVKASLHEVPVKGMLARSAPYVLPVLQATRGRIEEFPPLSIDGELSMDLVYRADGDLDRESTFETAHGGGVVTLASGELSTSRVLDGYSTALFGLGASSLVRGVLPAKLAFDGLQGPFTIARGRVTLPLLPLKGKDLDLILAGEVQLNGAYRVGIKTRAHGDGIPDEAKAALRALDRAGGVRVVGDLEDDSCAGELPPLEDLAEAARAEGALEALLKGGGDALDALRKK